MLPLLSTHCLHTKTSVLFCSMILGANTDSSIDVSDPISDQFYKEVWMTTAARNATVYQNASASTIRFIKQK